MEKKQFTELIQLLKNIETKLDMLIKLMKTSVPQPKVAREESKILKLCNQKIQLTIW